jgi:hypothetical protein
MALDGPGFHVEVGALDEAAAGITQSVQYQDTFELRGLCGEAGLYGHAGLHDALSEFCVRWSDGLDALTDDAEAIGHTLSRVAQVYRAVDGAAARSLGSDPGVGAVGG